MPDRPRTLPTTWSQHAEDVRLWRVLRDREPGFYVDVGAMGPSADSVTRVFYDFGWRGIDVEPDHTHAERLRRGRPGDQVLEAAASDDSGTMTFHRVSPRDGSASGLSTVDEEIARRHQAAGLEVDTFTVDRIRLGDVMADSPAADPDRFHFLKVDVEGHEAAVLRGCQLDLFRPLVIVFEAREPNGPAETFGESEAVLLGAGYIFAADDGLNRWYVRQEDEHLAAILAPEINPLTDGSPRRADDLAQIEALSARINELDAELRDEKRLRDEIVSELTAKIDAMRSSLPWKLTAPIRAARRAVGRRRG